MDLRGKRILVTGASGFLGKHVVRSLHREWAEPIVASSDSCDLTKRRRTLDFVRHSSCSAIIHLAARCGGISANIASPSAMLIDNIRIGGNLLEAAAICDVKSVVLANTICSYPSETPAPFMESSLWNGRPENSNAPYGIAKLAVMELADAHAREGKLTPMNLFLANLFGPGDNFDRRTSHVVPAIIRKVIEAQKTRAKDISVWGDGTPTRDFFYVTDAADAIVRALEAEPNSEPINVGTGRETSIREVAELVCEMLNWHGEIIWDTSKPNGQQRRVLDTSRAKERLGWEATTKFEDGLRRTVEWYLETQK